nr:hypothetical protein BaRGS_000444 [Batillaria attramentaria]
MNKLTQIHTNVTLFQGKGSVQTYWLTGENPDVRKQRLRKLNHLLQLPSSFDNTDSPYTTPASSIRPYLNNSSPHASVGASPNHSPMPSRPSKVRLAESAPTPTAPLVYDIFKDSDSARGGSGDLLNGLNPFRGRLHSVKDALSQRRNKLAFSSNSTSEPLIHDSDNNHKTARESCSNPMQEAVKGNGKVTEQGHRRDNAHCVSIYDNACPTELSVLLGERSSGDGFEDVDREGAEAETKFSLDFPEAHYL